MKRILSAVLILLSVLLCSCGKQAEKEVKSLDGGDSDTIISETAKTYTTTTSPEETTTEQVDNSTVKETVITYKTAENKYQLKINYKNISDLKTKVKKYTSLKNILKQGNISVKQNADCSNPFSEQGLSMIFEDKKVVVPVAEKGYTLKSVFLSSNKFFNYIYSDKDKKTYALRIYTSIYDIDQNTSKFALSFTDKNGNDIYKNTDGYYCWFIDDKYVALFTGKDKNFINGIRYSSVTVK